MNDTILAGLIAAVVSLLVSVLTVRIERRKIASEERRHALDHRRHLTEKLLDLRLKAYPTAFAITDQLTSPLILRDARVAAEYFAKVKEDLLAWNRSEGAFLYTKASLRAYRALISSLSLSPREDGTFSRDQRHQVWKCKNRFRGTLKSDLKLLYEEDQPESEDDSSEPSAE